MDLIPRHSTTIHLIDVTFKNVYGTYKITYENVLTLLKFT